MKLSEMKQGSKTIETETGTATLRPDGSMLLDNSGYKQELSPEQVQAAWSGADHLPLSQSEVARMRNDGLSDEEMLEYSPFRDGPYWDFGDEMHIIPNEEDFAG